MGVLEDHTASILRLEVSQVRSVHVQKWRGKDRSERIRMANQNQEWGKGD
jgi:hypothetical protein